MDKTIIGRIGKGVIYTSVEDCTTLGIGGRSLNGEATASAPSGSTLLPLFLHLPVKLGLCMLAFPKDTRPSTLRIADRVGVSYSSSRAESLFPNVLRGVADSLLDLGVVMVRKKDGKTW